MRVTTGQTIATSPVLYRGLVLGLAALASCSAVVGVSATFRGQAPSVAAEPVALVAPTPTAVEFGVVLVETANAFAAANGNPVRISQPDCVQASRGHYMCSYVVTRPSGARTCHVMQAEWTQGEASSYRVTLAGRAGRCGSLREALRSLR